VWVRGFRGVTALVACLLILIVVPGQSRAASISISSPVAWQVVQRGSDGTADIIVTGRLAGQRGGVEARWHGGPWTLGKRRNGAFRVVLRAQPAGQGTLVVRSVIRPGLVARHPLVGVGDVYVIAGQSNASGRAGRWYDDHVPGLRAAMFGNDYRWQDLHDPVDSPVGQVDGVSLDKHPGGSVWPLVASRLMLADQAPVAFIPCALGGTRIERWQPDAPPTLHGDRLFDSMRRRIRAAGGRVRAVLWWQGEADARLQTPHRTYERLLGRLATAVRRDCRAPLVAAQIGDFRPQVSPAAAVNAVRLAQADSWTRPGIVSGPVLYDIGLRRHVHVVHDADVRAAADRWAAAIIGGVLHDGTPYSPRLRSATYDGRVTVTLMFSTPHSALRVGRVGGIVVRSEGRWVAVVREVSLRDRVLVVLRRPALAPLTVSLGEGRTAVGRQVPREDSAWRLPAEAFVDRRVRRVRSDPGSAASPAGAWRRAPAAAPASML
jgi:Carbohydrate esterase, sialic acid-specific acetylesterase